MIEFEYDEKKQSITNMDGSFDEDFNKLNLQGGFYQRREILKLPPSAKFILYLLRMKGPLNRKRIIEETMMPDRTVGFALKKLLVKNLIEKVDLDGSSQHSSTARRRRRRKDRRITNYSLVAGFLPFGITPF